MLVMSKQSRQEHPPARLWSLQFASLQYGRVSSKGCRMMAGVLTRGFLEEVRSWPGWTKAEREKRVILNQQV